MSASNEWTEWHLTPGGWVRGTEKTDFKSSTVYKDSPEDRVLTCTFHEKIPSIYSKAHRWVDEDWRSDNEDEVKRLLEQYGACPESL